VQGLTSREPTGLAYLCRELAALADLWREPVVQTYHLRELVILANLRKKGTSLGYCGTNMNYKKFTEEQAKSIKRSPVIHTRVIYLSREPAVLAN
jgi:hypothetical protein